MRPRDQAATLRSLTRLPRTPSEAPRRRTIAITGGKGGIGKSTISVNLAAAWARREGNVLMVDGDMGMADLNLLLGIAPALTVVDVLEGRSIDEVIVEAHGIAVLPGLNGSYGAANLDKASRERLLGAIADLHDRYETLILDTAAGIGEATVGLAGAASEVVVVCNPEPLSIADAYACLKVLSLRTGLPRAFLLPNQVRSPSEAEETVTRLQGLVDRFLGIELVPLPPIPHDPMVRMSGSAGIPIVLHQPESPASRAIERVTRRIDQLAAPTQGRGALDKWTASAVAREVSR